VLTRICSGAEVRFNLNWLNEVTFNVATFAKLLYTKPVEVCVL
jgi:hypothetical protein